MQGVACHGIPAGSSLAAGDGIACHGKAGGSHVTSESRECNLCGIPSAVAIVSAVGAHVGIVSGALGETFNSSRVGGHVNRGNSAGVEVSIGAIGNLPSILGSCTIGPAQRGGVGGLSSAVKVGNWTAGRSQRHFKVVYAAAILTAVVPTEDQACGVVRNTVQVIGTTFHHSAAISNGNARNGGESVKLAIILIGDVSKGKRTIT